MVFGGVPHFSLSKTNLLADETSDAASITKEECFDVVWRSRTAVRIEASDAPFFVDGEAGEGGGGKNTVSEKELLLRSSRTFKLF